MKLSLGIIIVQTALLVLTAAYNIMIKGDLAECQGAAQMCVDIANAGK